jgi:hypothetical protein
MRIDSPRENKSDLGREKGHGCSIGRDALGLLIGSPDPAIGPVAGFAEYACH